MRSRSINNGTFLEGVLLMPSRFDGILSRIHFSKSWDMCITNKNRDHSTAQTSSLFTPCQLHSTVGSFNEITLLLHRLIALHYKPLTLVSFNITIFKLVPLTPRWRDRSPASEDHSRRYFDDKDLQQCDEQHAITRASWTAPVAHPLAVIYEGRVATMWQTWR